MKKLILLFITLSAFQVETEAMNNVSSNKKTTVSTASSEVKIVVKRRRKKKGFLWGLFKKNDCGCPKH